MKLFHPALWSAVLAVWASLWETEASSSDICEDVFPGELNLLDSLNQRSNVQKDNAPVTFSCLFYPTNVLNCSWLFHTLEEDAQLSVHIRLCDENQEFYSWSNSSKEKGGSWSHNFHEGKDVIIHMNMSQPDKWEAYTYLFDLQAIEVLSPPSNISASVNGGDLLVTWNLPGSQTGFGQHCFEYQLDLGNQVKNLTSKQSCTELYDPTQTYNVRIRARTINTCSGSSEWSEWSDTVTVEQSVYKSNLLVIVLFSLGIPMILLAVLLLVHHQRVTQLLFPPIPSPPPKYINFLEKGDVTNIFYAAQTPKTEEEIITEVEDAVER